MNRFVIVVMLVFMSSVASAASTFSAGLILDDLVFREEGVKVAPYEKNLIGDGILVKYKYIEKKVTGWECSCPDMSGSHEGLTYAIECCWDITRDIIKEDIIIFKDAEEEKRWMDNEFRSSFIDCEVIDRWILVRKMLRR